MKIWKILLIILLVAFGFREWFMLDAGVHRGKGFTIEFPKTWEELPLPEQPPAAEGEEMPELDIVVFVSPEKDSLTDINEASITVFSLKLDQAAWLEDEFPRIKKAIEETGSFIVKDGMIEIDGEVSQWILYHDKKNKMLNLEFYIITKGNMFYKIHYAAADVEFKKHRDDFEKAKDTFKITGFRL